VNNSLFHLVTETILQARRESMLLPCGSTSSYAHKKIYV